MRSWIASISSRTSSFSATSALAMLLRSCSMVVAPMMLLVTNARLFTQASAIWAGSRPCLRATSTYSAVAARPPSLR